MQSKVYTETQRACPRFDYSVRQFTSLINRTRALLNELDITLIFNPPDLSTLQIQVVSYGKPSDILTLKDLLQRPSSEKIGETNQEDDINDKLPHILVVHVDEEPDDLDKYDRNNVIIVSDRDDVVDALAATAKEKTLHLLSITEKQRLKINIATLLERVVFRNICDLLDILRGLLAVAIDQRTLHNYINDSVDNLVKSWIAKESILISIETEFNAEHAEYDIYPAINEIPVTEKVKTKLREISDKMPYLKCMPSMGIENTDGKYLWHYLIFKMAKAASYCINMTVVELFNGIPEVVRRYFKISDTDMEYQHEILMKGSFKLLVSIIEKEQGPFDCQKLLYVLRDNKKELKSKLKMLAMEQPQISSKAKQIEMLQSETHMLRGFIGEIAGMYNRSDVPQHERPISPILGRKLHENVAEALFGNCENIKGCGYRYDRLTIFYDIADDRKAELDQLNRKIQRVLTKYGITEYDVTPATKSMKHYKKVGAKIEVSHCGTLGGFAHMTQPPPKTPVLCALLSKHVVNGAHEVFLVNNGDDKIQIGSMIRAECYARQYTLIDVAAAKILDEYKNKCETNFKNTHGESRPCLLFDKQDISFLSGLPVHIYGATTELGRGIISMPQYTVNDPTDPKKGDFMIIEDVKEGESIQTRFSSKGDSGAVVCADDRDDECVHVISMLVGCLNHDDIKKDPKRLGKYFCFRMTSAFEKLEIETGQQFHLCSERNCNCTI